MKKECCICGVPIEGWGHNPTGAACKLPDGSVKLLEFPSYARCCNECNEKYVIPGRLYRLEHKK